MKNRKRQSALLALSILLLPAGAAFAATEGWAQHSLTIDITDELDIAFGQDSRSVDTLTYTGTPYLKSLQGGMNFKLPWRFKIGAAYRFEDSDPAKGTAITLKEQRIIGEVSWHMFVFGFLRYDFRFRFESQSFEGGGTNGSRMRGLAKMSGLLRFGDLKLRPVVWYEHYLGDNAGSEKELAFGFEFPLRTDITFNVGLFMHTPHTGAKFNAFVTGFDLNF
jgi:hypothetical protein